MDLVTRELVLEAIPSLAEPAITRIVTAGNSQIARSAPCLVTSTDEGLLAEAEQIIYEALRRNGEVDAWAEKLTTGPYSVEVRPGAVALSAFTDADLSALAGLCASVPRTALPRGSFPPPLGDRTALYRWPT